MSPTGRERGWKVGKVHPRLGLNRLILVLIPASAVFLTIVVLVHGGPFTPEDGPSSSLVAAVALAMVLLFAAAILVSVLGINRATDRLERYGVRASSAIVTHVRYREPEGGESESWDLSYMYEAPGFIGYGSRSFGHPPRLDIGDPVPIVYDPDHPDVHGWLIIS